MQTLPKNAKSLWREFYTPNLYAELKGQLEVDAVIIGAGITGLTSAYLLKKAGLKVAVLDKDTVGGGTSGRTTGKVTSQHGLIYETLVKQSGKKAAKAYAEANQAAVEMVNTIIKSEEIDCDWKRDDNYVFTTDLKKIEQFKKEAAISADLGLPATFVDKLPLPFEIKAAVKFSGQGKFASQKYLHGLAAAVNGQGSYVFEHSNVISIRDGQPCRIKTRHGEVIAKDIIVATNVPTLPLVARGGYCSLEYPTESYIIAAPYNKKLGGMYISPDKNHYSILPINIEGKQHLLIGGGGHVSGFRINQQWRFNNLYKYANKHFNITEITHKWSDRDYMAYDKIPMIGKLYPWSKHLYVGTAFNKWGLSSGTIAGMILSDLITKKENKWAPVFTPQRLKPITSIPSAVLEQIKQLTSP